MAIFLTLSIVSGFWVMPRIFQTPDPKNEARFHQHNGDGFTETGVLAAHQYWKRFGYTGIHFLPCIDVPTPITASCTPYTHYPAGIYLLSSLLLDGFESFSTPEQALVQTRIVFYIFTLLLCTVALFLFSQTLELSLANIFITSVVLGISRGFWLFADNLFGNGLVLGLFGIILALSLHKINRPILYFFLALLSTFFSVELIPAIFLFPLFNAGNFFGSNECRKKIFKLWVAAFIGVALIMSIRLLQNAWHHDSLALALRDWIDIIKFRIFGDAKHGLPSENTVVISASSDFLFEYLSAWFHNQRIMITKLGIAIIWSVILFFAVLKKRRELWIVIFSYALCIQWGVFFIQHSMIHLFTFRYVVWAPAISVALFINFVLNKLIQKN